MKEHQSAPTINDTSVLLPYKGVIFDMDGTLIASTQADYLAWEKVFADHGRKLSYEDYVPLLGIKSANVVQHHLGISDEEEVKRILKEKLDFFVEIVTVKPIKPVFAAEAFLKSLANYPVKVALATSSRKAKMEMVLNQLNFLPYFDAIVTGEEVENSKPAPDVFLKAAERLGLVPGDCFVVEDTPAGVAAAKNAKMKCLAITETHAAEKLTQADVFIDTYENADFIEISQRLAASSSF